MLCMNLLDWTTLQPELEFSFFHKESTGYFVLYCCTVSLLDIKEIYGILKEQENSEYFKSLKPERALDLDHPMLFFSLD